MTKRQTKWTLAVVVAVLLVLALTLTVRTVLDQPKVYSPPEWQNLTPEQREQRLDEEERKRRASGRGPSRRKLPEDPAVAPPASPAPIRPASEETTDRQAQ